MYMTVISRMANGDHVRLMGVMLPCFKETGEVEKHGERYMELHIDGEYSFQSVQGQFTALYPFLKIDILRLSKGRGAPLAKAGTPSSRMERSSLEGRIGHFTRNQLPVTLNMNGQRTVFQVVNDFECVLGIPVVILRRSGQLWIGTSLTADWTLEQQNREGEFLTQMG